MLDISIHGMNDPYELRCLPEDTDSLAFGPEFDVHISDNPSVKHVWISKGQKFSDYLGALSIEKPTFISVDIKRGPSSDNIRDFLEQLMEQDWLKKIRVMSVHSQTISNIILAREQLVEQDPNLHDRIVVQQMVWGANKRIDTLRYLSHKTSGIVSEICIHGGYGSTKSRRDKDKKDIDALQESLEMIENPGIEEIGTWVGRSLSATLEKTKLIEQYGKVYHPGGVMSISEIAEIQEKSTDTISGVYYDGDMPDLKCLK